MGPHGGTRPPSEQLPLPPFGAPPGASFKAPPQGKKLSFRALKKLASEGGITPAQALLRWSLARGHVPLAKSVTPSRIAENYAAWGAATTVLP